MNAGKQSSSLEPRALLLMLTLATCLQIPAAAAEVAAFEVALSRHRPTCEDDQVRCFGTRSEVRRLNVVAGETFPLDEHDDGVPSGVVVRRHGVYVQPASVVDPPAALSLWQDTDGFRLDLNAAGERRSYPIAADRWTRIEFRKDPTVGAFYVRARELPGGGDE